MLYESAYVHCQVLGTRQLSLVEKGVNNSNLEPESFLKNSITFTWSNKILIQIWLTLLGYLFSFGRFRLLFHSNARLICQYSVKDQIIRVKLRSRIFQNPSPCTKNICNIVLKVLDHYYRSY